MHEFKERLLKLEKFLGSLKFSVIIISLFTIMMIIGTFVESYYGTDFTNRIIYKSPFFIILQTLMFVSIFIATLIRFPFKKRLYGFVVIHLGILIVFLGAFVTYTSGVDGTISLRPNSPTREIVLSQDLLYVIYPEDKKEISLELPYSAFTTNINDKIRDVIIKDYIPFAEYKLKWIINEQKDKMSSSYMIFNDNFKKEVSFSNHPKSSLKKESQFGPIIIQYIDLGQFKSMDKSKHQKGLNLFLMGNTVSFYNKYKKKWMQHDFTKDKIVELPWIGLKLSLNNHTNSHYPKYGPTYSLNNKDNTLRAVSIEIDGEQFWINSQQPRKFKSNGKTILVELSRKKIKLPYQITLERFQMNKNPGTNTPASFESFVDIFNGQSVKKHHIYMNHPLKYKNFTFYQSSYFELDQDTYGSVLSANYDPGRSLKYFGCLILVIGCMWHFQIRYSNKKGTKS